RQPLREQQHHVAGENRLTGEPVGHEPEQPVAEHVLAEGQGVPDRMALFAVEDMRRRGEECARVTGDRPHDEPLIQLVDAEEGVALEVDGVWQEGAGRRQDHAHYPKRDGEVERSRRHRAPPPAHRGRTGIRGQHPLPRAGLSSFTTTGPRTPATRRVMSTAPAMPEPSPVPTALHVTVVVPALDAARTLRGVLEGIPRWVRTVVVVSDGSRDAPEHDEAGRAGPRVILEAHAHRLRTAPRRAGR